MAQEVMIAMQSEGKFLILGDFNYREIDWNTLDPYGGKNKWRFKLPESM